LTYTSSSYLIGESTLTNTTGKLLRVPKAGTRAFKHDELQEYWETAVRPLFGDEDLVQQFLVKLGGRDIVSRLNAVLQKHDASRREDFKGSQVDVAEYGMLVEDMRKSMRPFSFSIIILYPSHTNRPIPEHPQDITFEFKPKWLLQSPNAPPTAIRCRNCAREASRHHMSGKPPKTGGILCPLDYLECGTEPEALERVLTHLAKKSHINLFTIPKSQYDHLVTWFKTNTLLPRLREAQLANDRSSGPLNASPNNDTGFPLAMTLRDCSCFVRVRARTEEDSHIPHIEAKLADLDKKKWEAKMGYWQKTERDLAEGGFYTGTEEPRQKTNCRLERGMGASNSSSIQATNRSNNERK